MLEGNVYFVVKKNDICEFFLVEFTLILYVLDVISEVLLRDVLNSYKLVIAR